MANLNTAISRGGQGAVTGGAIGGPIGAGIGGALGVASSFMGDDPQKLIKEAQAKANAEQTKLNQNYQSNVNKAMNPYNSMVDMGNITNSMNMAGKSLTGNNPLDFAVDAGQYKSVATNPLDSVNSYLDPTIKYQQEQAMNQIQESAGGTLFSGATGQEIANKTADIARLGWDNAYDKARTQVQDTNSATQSNFNNSLNAGNQSANFLDSRNTNLLKANELYRNPLDTVTNVNLGVNDKMYGSQSAMNQQNLSTNLGLANQPSTWDSIMGVVNQVPQGAWDKMLR